MRKFTCYKFHNLFFFIDEENSITNIVHIFTIYSSVDCCSHFLHILNNVIIIMAESLISIHRFHQDMFKQNHNCFCWFSPSFQLPVVPTVPKTFPVSRHVCRFLPSVSLPFTLLELLNVSDKKGSFGTSKLKHFFPMQSLGKKMVYLSTQLICSQLHYIWKVKTVRGVMNSSYVKIIFMSLQEIPI